MPQSAACPRCTHQFPVTEARQAFAVACPACDAEMTVEFKQPAKPPEAGQPHYDLVVKAGALAAPAPLPLKKKKKSIDEDDQPQRSGGSGAIVILSAGFGLSLVLGGLGLTAWVLFGLIDTTPTASASNNNRASGTSGRPVFTPPSVTPPGPNFNPPPVRPSPPFVPPITRPSTPRPNPNPPAGNTAPPAVGLPVRPAPSEIKPAPVTEATSYKLPEPVRALRVGGDGRFLILHFPKMRKLGIFDANESKIVRYVSAPEEDAQFAAGMDKLVVYLPGSKVIMRYNLLTGAREKATRLDLPGRPVEAFCMGHASAGPLLIGVAGQGARLYDIDKFKEIELPAKDDGFGRTVPQRLEGGYYWAGATGRVFGHTGNYGQPNGVKTVVLGEGGIQQYGEHQGTWFVMPGPDDKYVYAGGHGIVSERVRPVPNVPFSMGPGSGFASHLYLPAHHGPFYLHAMTIENFGRDDKTPVGTVRLYMHGSKEPIATYEKTAVCKYGWEGLRGLGIEYSLHLIPRAKLLIIVPESRDELRLYPADLEAALEKAGRDYVLITSAPPAKFAPGKSFTYQAEAKARKGPVTFRLESGPPGMTASETGLVAWSVPAGFAEDRVDVLLVAKDATGQEAFHAFTLTK